MNQYYIVKSRRNIQFNLKTPSFSFADYRVVVSFAIILHY